MIDMGLTIISYIAIIATIIHLWKLRPFSNGVCVAVTIGLLLFGRITSVWMDYLTGAIIIIAPIVMWISEGFWVALITFFVALIAVSLLFGLGSKTEWRNETGRYSITCHKCNYGGMEILSSDENGVYARCKR